MLYMPRRLCLRCGGSVLEEDGSLSCLVCGWESVIKPVKIRIDWPPIANLNGEHHTHPILDADGLSGGDDD